MWAALALHFRTIHVGCCCTAHQACMWAALALHTRMMHVDRFCTAHQNTHVGCFALHTKSACGPLLHCTPEYACGLLCTAHKTCIWLLCTPHQKVCTQGLPCLIETSLFAAGEYVAAEKIEAAYKKNMLVEQIWVYGNSFESTLVAIVVPAGNPCSMPSQIRASYPGASLVSWQQLREHPGCHCFPSK